MNTRSYNTISTAKEKVDRKWFIVDAEGLVVGRLCTRIATVLRGKHKAIYTPHTDCGDYVIVINADKVRFTGNKMLDKVYITYSGYPSGHKETTPARLMHPDSHELRKIRVVENAVKGMLPKNKLGKDMFRKLFVYSGADYPHQAQQPQDLIK